MNFNKDIVEHLEKLSYKSELGVSFKRSLKRFDKDELVDELLNVKEFYDNNKILENAKFQYRIKSLQSMLLKYDKYYPNTEIKKCFNDILGIRVLVNDYNELEQYTLSKMDIVNMLDGKAKDDGYRGIHLYYQKTNYHYPIEIQINSKNDRFFNDFLHKYVYKYYKNSNVGKQLRKIYEEKGIKSYQHLKEELEYVLHSGKEI